ncbi:MAG: hypothetical protein IJ043_11830 [Clostridia bacterium]|nr:hypothetical protein [Clostridia bacterium]
MKTAYEQSKELIRRVTPAMSYGSGDLREWQVSAKEKLAWLLGMEKFQKVDPNFCVEYQKKIEGATEIRFTFQSETGYYVPCHLLLPDGIKNPPLMICLQGHSKGMHISLGRPKFEGDEKSINSGDRDFCVRAVKEGFATIALEQRNFGECGGDETGRPNCFESTMTALLMGRTTIGERVWDVSRLIDVVEAEFSDQIDIHNICCMGNSGGGTATAYIAALEDRIVLAMPSCAMCTFKDSIGAMKHCSCNYVPHIAEYFDMNDLMAMAYPKYYVQVSGIEDPIFPLFGAEQVFEKGKQAYESQEKGNRCTMVKGNGGHRFYADDAWPVVHQYLKKTE